MEGGLRTRSAPLTRGGLASSFYLNDVFVSIIITQKTDCPRFCKVYIISSNRMGNELETRRETIEKEWFSPI